MKLPLYWKDVGPHLLDGFYGRPPFEWTARNGQEGIVRALLSFQDVNPTSITKGDLTPLRFAVIHGQEGEVELLNVWKDIKPNLVDRQWGQTSLSLAAMEGCESIV